MNKKTSTLFFLIFLILLGLIIYTNSQQKEINDYNNQRIQSLENTLIDLEDKIELMNSNTDTPSHNDLNQNNSGAENILEINSGETMVVSFPVYSGSGSEYVYASKDVQQSDAVLTAAYEVLFTAPSNVSVFGVGARNQVPESGLSFDAVSVSEGIANVKLSGDYMFMEMGDLIFRNQINKTAFQYPTIDTVTVELNGTTFDWCMTDQSDGEGGCPETPRYWIDSRE